MPTVWLYVLTRELARQPRQLAGRLLVISATALVLASFAFVLPAYRASFTAAIEEAAFDVDLAACTCREDDVTKISKLPGVDRALPALGIGGLGLSTATASVGAWAWAVDSAEDADLLPLSPQYLIAGSYSIGSAAAPQAVIDLELARQLDAAPGDRIAAKFGEDGIELTVAGITGPAARFRGPALVMRRDVVTPFIPADSELREAPFTEVFIAGDVAPEAVAALFPAGTTAVYSKADQLAAQIGQIEVDQPVITVFSSLAGVGLIAVLLFAGWQAIDRRRQLLSLLPHLGSRWSTGLLATVIIEASPAAVATAAATIVGLEVIVNGYFAGIGAYVAPAMVGLAAATVAFATLVSHAVTYGAAYRRLVSR